MEKSEENVLTDIIILLDESGSMSVMGNEPIESANEFIKKQQKNEDNSRLTIISFSSSTKKIIKNKPLQEIKEISQEQYNPSGSTSLNDCICTTICNRLSSNKTNNVILLIITDGHENSSRQYNKNQTKEYLRLVQKKYGWQVLFIGANINAFEEGEKLSINSSNCAQFDQKCPGNLLSLMRTASDQITEYNRSKTNGDENPVLLMPLNSTKSEPIFNNKNSYDYNIVPNFPKPFLIRSRSKS